MSKNSRSYCVTFWKKPEPTVNEDKIRYAIYGHEICPETKKEHWQSYIELNSPISLTALKKIYNDNTLHGEKRIGTREQARDYCKKDNAFIEIGTWIKGQGHRSDLANIVEQMKNGTKLDEIILNETETYCKYRNGLKDVNALLIKKRTKTFRKLEVILITGPTRCGKTRQAVQEAGEDYYKIEGYNLDWFQDYNEEKTLIIDEYLNNVEISKLLTLLDGYQLRLNIKGSHTYANWNKVYITTNLKPDELHRQAITASRDALFARITEIRNFWPDKKEHEVVHR